MTTYPRRIAEQRADILGWEHDHDNVFVHHRTKNTATLYGADVGSNSYSPHWWLDVDQTGDVIELCGTRLRTAA